MIALCHTHHDHADGGTWTDEDLRALKRAPFLADQRVSDRLGWMRRSLILRVGGGNVVDCDVFLELCGQRVVWGTRDSAGRLLLNLDLRDRDGNPLFTMVDNDWIAAKDIHDLEAAPQDLPRRTSSSSSDSARSTVARMGSADPLCSSR
jgi:hypothetical protein